MEYKEHEKLQAVKAESQAIGAFLDWLTSEQGYLVAKRHQHGDGCCDSSGRRSCWTRSGDLVATNESITRLLARYFDIDEGHLEEEKRAMLEEMRSVNTRTP